MMKYKDWETFHRSAQIQVVIGLVHALLLCLYRGNAFFFGSLHLKEFAGE